MLPPTSSPSSALPAPASFTVYEDTTASTPTLSPLLRTSANSHHYCSHRLCRGGGLTAARKRAAEELGLDADLKQDKSWEQMLLDRVRGPRGIVDLLKDFIQENKG